MRPWLCAVQGRREWQGTFGKIRSYPSCQKRLQRVCGELWDGYVAKSLMLLESLKRKRTCWWRNTKASNMMVWIPTITQGGSTHGGGTIEESSGTCQHQNRQGRSVGRKHTLMLEQGGHARPCNLCFDERNTVGHTQTKKKEKASKRTKKGALHSQTWRAVRGFWDCSKKRGSGCAVSLSKPSTVKAGSQSVKMWYH